MQLIIFDNKYALYPTKSWEMCKVCPFKKFSPPPPSASERPPSILPHLQKPPCHHQTIRRRPIIRRDFMTEGYPPTACFYMYPNLQLGHAENVGPFLLRDIQSQEAGWRNRNILLILKFCYIVYICLFSLYIFILI